MKRTASRFLSVFLTICMLLSLVPMALAAGADKFTDVPADAWYRTDVSYVAEHGYFNGTSETTFSPADNMTRAMFVAVLSRVDGQNLNDSAAPFSDVASGAWYAGEVKWASDNSIVTGVGGGRFDPDGFVTRQQMATIMARYIAYYAAKDKVTFQATGSTAAFADAAQIADYAKEAVTLCRSYGLVNGNNDGTFAPEANSTRAQVAAVIHRLALLLATGTPVTTPSGGSSGGGGSGTTASSVTAKTAADFIAAAEKSATNVTATIADDNNLTVNDDVTINATATTLTLNLGKASLGKLTVNAPYATTINLNSDNDTNNNPAASVASLTINAPNATVNNGVKVNGSVNIQAVSDHTFINNAPIIGNIVASGHATINNTQEPAATVVVATAAAVTVSGNTTDIKVTADNAKVTVAPTGSTAPKIESSADNVNLTVANDNTVTISGQVATVKATSVLPNLDIEAAIGTLTATNARDLVISGKGSVQTVDSKNAEVRVAGASAVSIVKLTMTGGSLSAPANAVATVEASGTVELKASVNTVKADAGTTLNLGSGATVNTVAASGSLTVGGDTGSKINSIDVASSATISKSTTSTAITVSAVTKTDANANVSASGVGVTDVKTKAATPTGVGFTAPTTAGGNGTITGVTSAMEYKSSAGVWIDISGTTVTGVAPGSYEVRVKATSTALASEAVTGTIPAAVAVSSAAIQGTPYVGQILTAVANAKATGTLSYVWKAGGDEITGAIGKTFTLTDAQIGKAISVTISNYNGANHAEATTGATNVTVDKTALNTLIAKAAELQKGVTVKDNNTTAAAVAKGIVFVTTSEQTALTNAVTAATTAANNASANTQAVNDAEAALRTANAAYVNAKKVGTDDSVSTLQAALTALVGQATAAENQVILTAEKAELVAPDRSWVTSTVASAYSTAIVVASDKESSTDAAVLTAAITDLKAAMNTYLKAIQKGAALDRTALDAAVNAAEINAASVEISTTGTCNTLLPSQTWVTEANLGTYNAAIATAKSTSAAKQNDYISALNTLTTATSTFNAAKAPGTKDIVPPTVTLGDATLTDGIATITLSSNENGTYKYQIGSTDGTWIGTADQALTAGENATLVVNTAASSATVYIQVSDASGNATIVSADVGTASENAVASVGAAKYDTLAAAIDAATSGQTVKLLKDVTLNETITINKTLTLDLNGTTLTEVGPAARRLQNTGTLTINGNNGTIQNQTVGSGTADDDSGSYGIIDNKGTLTANAVTFKDVGCGYGSSVRNRSGATATLNGCTVTASGTGTYGNSCVYSDGTIIINGGSFTNACAPNGSYCIISAAGSITVNAYNDVAPVITGTKGGIGINSGTAVINAGTITGNSYYGVWVTNDGTSTHVTVNDGAIYGKIYGLYAAVDDGAQDAGSAGVVVNGGTFSGGTAAAIAMKNDNSVQAWSLSITGGTFSTDPSAYVAPGYEATNSESVWTVAKISAESANANVQVGSNYYKTLSDAVAAATSGQTVKLMKNVTLTNTTISIAKTLSLDLNGFNITGNTRVFEIKAGTLTLDGSGTVRSDFAPAGTSSVIKISASSGNAELIVGKDVTVYSATSYAISLFGSETNAKKLTVNGTVTSENTLTGDASAIAGLGTASGKNTQININSGAKVNSKYGAAIYHPQQGTLTVNDGAEIKGATGIEVKAGTVVLNGGAITATGTQGHTANGNGTSTTGYAVALVENAGYGTGSTVSVTISGGTFTGPVEKVQDSERAGEETLSITGGTFSSNPTSSYLAPGYTAKPTNNNTWTVAATATEYQ